MANTNKSDVLGPLNEVTDTLTKTANRFENLDGSDLPANFGEVPRKLPLIQKTLVAVERHINLGGVGAEPSKGWENVKRSMVECNNRANDLHRILTEVVPKRGTQRMEQVYKDAAGHKGRVELLLEKMLKGVLNIATATVIPHSEVGELQKAVEEVSRLEPSIKAADLPPVHEFHNNGAGPQNVQTGTGTQNNNNGGGYQITGEINGGLNFGGSQPVGAAEEATGVARAAPVAQRRRSRPAKKAKEVAKGL